MWEFKINLKGEIAMATVKKWWIEEIVEDFYNEETGLNEWKDCWMITDGIQNKIYRKDQYTKEQAWTAWENSF